MKILFLIYHGFSEVSGISKKIHYQVKGLQQNGHEVHLCYYDFNSNGHRCRFVDDKIIKDYGKGRIAAICSRVQLTCIYDYCIANKIDVVYVRSFMNASPMQINLFGKLKKKGVKCFMEIPTYPYDSEVNGYEWNDKVSLWIDKMFRRKLSSKMEAIVTFSNEDYIFGQKTIKISNGIDFDSIPLHKYKGYENDDIHLIGVAEVHYWHGFDRLVAGMGEYYKHNPNGRRIFFHVVGCEDYRGMSNIGYSTIDQVAQKYGIEKYIIKHGQLFGEQLDEVFNQCVFAVGSLGRHRSGITDIKTLKNREYAARGMSFIYSENDSDFDDKPYVLKAPANESPIYISRIIDYISNNTLSSEEIRQSVGHLSWKCQMQKVIEYTNQ